MFQNEPFQGDKKVGLSLLGKWEKKIVEKYTPKIPRCIETYHLTLTTLLWCAIIIVCGYLAQYNFHWLWGTSVAIALQYSTDLFDGAVGRYRDTGLIRWGYYMDHFLDYIFLCSILIGYSFTLQDRFNTLFFTLAIFGAYMVNSYLAFAATNRFKIAFFKIGPTEMRLAFIITNTLLIIFQKTYLAWTLPAIFWLSLIGLAVVVYSTQKQIWAIDMAEKKAKQKTTA
ncbi:MAG TPA: CDP-alcohol phosphatidyltransferase family protein [Patescibacteria group bacterium]|nr:CDP-alcohol phosphatidyltransferase family protein [Patescibacteria group bacterium]